MNTYKVTLEDGQTFIFSANMVEASAPITVNFHDADSDHDWQSTPYQTADAQHRPERAAELLAEHFAVDEDDCMDVESVRLVGG